MLSGQTIYMPNTDLLGRDWGNQCVEQHNTKFCVLSPRGHVTACLATTFRFYCIIYYLSQRRCRRSGAGRYRRNLHRRRRPRFPDHPKTTKRTQGELRRRPKNINGKVIPRYGSCPFRTRRFRLVTGVEPLKCPELSVSTTILREVEFQVKSPEISAAPLPWDDSETNASVVRPLNNLANVVTRT